MMKESLVKEVLELYHNQLYQNGKPQNIEEFTVLAAIIAQIDPVSSDKVGKEDGSDTTVKVISLATGTKCVGEEIIDKEGHIIHDSHAEVIARRAFLRYLLELVLLLEKMPSLQDEFSCPLTRKNPESSREGYRIKHNWSFYLYISDSPCGDACIYPSLTGEMCFTGAKLAAMMEDSPYSDPSSIQTLGSIEISQKDNGLIVEKDQQLVGPARTKSSRSDTQHPTNSMSCSDKICRWLHLGVQGKALYRLVGKVELSGIIVGRDPSATAEAQSEALQRALLRRYEPDTRTCPPRKSIDILIVDEEGLQFSSSKGSVRHRLFSTAADDPNKTTNDIERTTEDREIGVGLKRAAENPELSSKKKLKKLQPVPCGTSINWISSPPSSNTLPAAPLTEVLSTYFDEIKHNIKPTKSGSQEVTIAHTGLPHGTTQKTRSGKGSAEGKSSDRPRGPKKLSISRLSPYALQWLCQMCLSEDKKSRETKPDILYKEWKNSLPAHSEYEENALNFFNKPIFSVWKRKQSEKVVALPS